jgi:large subunit ribosomal protein L24
MITKHVKPTAAKPQGGIEKKEASLHISNLMLVDPKTGETTRTGRKAGENGKLVRYSKKTGEVING